MKVDFPVEKTIKDRTSIRTYDESSLSAKDNECIINYFETLRNPFQNEVSFKLIKTDESVNGTKLGTYGVIKGAKTFIGATVNQSDLDLESLGYSFEKLILYATSLGLGTCWLGGTFNRSQFGAAMNVGEDVLFPAISPIGYPVGKKRLTEVLVKWVAKSDQRKGWEELFFNNDFQHPLSKVDAGAFAYPLEMLRFAPSAANKQPWRIVKEGKKFHFYEARTLGDPKKEAIDIQRVDMGIGACHFHLATIDKGMSGEFKKLPTPNMDIPNQMQYIFTWIN